MGKWSRKFYALVGILSVTMLMVLVVRLNLGNSNSKPYYNEQQIRQAQIEALQKAQQEVPTEYTETEQRLKTTGYETEIIDDPNLEYGKTEVRNPGVVGEKKCIYEVHYKDGKEISRELISEEVTKAPIKRVIAKGTKITWHCVDTTSYNKNAYDDNKCTSSTGEVRYGSDSQAQALDPTYVPGKAGHYYYNSK